MENPDTAIVPENLTAKVILMFQAVDKTETQDDVSSFLTYLERIKNKEMSAIFVTMFMTTEKGVRLGKNNKKIQEFVLANKHLLGEL